MGKFSIVRRKNGDFQFVLQAGNNEVVLTSQGYKSKASCKNGITSVMNNVGLDDCFDFQTSKGGQVYFNLLAANKKIIGTSEMYATKQAAHNGMTAVKKAAKGANIVDNSNE
jgi:uncharacterized protein